MLRLDDLHVDSFATTGAPTESAGMANAVAPTTYTVPYSMLGSCYGCPGESNVTICPATVVNTA